MIYWVLISWAAVVLGWFGSWVAGRRASGWLIGAMCSAIWLAYDIKIAVWSGAVSAVVAIVISVRNYLIGTTP